MQKDPLTATFAALADPTRRAILAQLISGPKTVTELAEPFDITMPAVTKHLKVLEGAHLIERSRRAQYRPCSLQPEPLRGAYEWIDQYRRLFEESFDRLDEYLRQLQAKEEDDEQQQDER